jgi:putative endonuclease
MGMRSAVAFRTELGAGAAAPGAPAALGAVGRAGRGARGAGTAVAFHSGLAAEETAARGYRGEGGRVRATRWRCAEGELDLVVELPSEIVFVEVKARRAGAGTVSARQWARIGAAATRWLAEHTDGATPCRFDLALVDAAGRLERIENARSFDGW